VGVWQRDYVLFDQLTRQAFELGLPVRFIVVTSEDVARALRRISGVEVHTGVSDEHLRDLYRQSDLLVLPLVQAAASNTLLEAMACGLPVLATGIGGVPEYVGDTAGRLVEPFRPDLMLEAIVGLAADPFQRAAMGRAARRRAREQDWQHSAELLTEVYSQVAAA
jgi:glycosyltransferase involved in cell wall biosynthesis